MKAVKSNGFNFNMSTCLCVFLPMSLRKRLFDKLACWQRTYKLVTLSTLSISGRLAASLARLDLDITLYPTLPRIVANNLMKSISNGAQLPIIATE